MLQIKPTKHLIGIMIQGDYNDLYDLVDSIYGMCGFDERLESPYYGAKDLLLGLCYETRHAYRASREILSVENGMNKDIMKWKEITAPSENVYFSTNIFFPEAIFLAIVLPETYDFSKKYYGRHSKYKGSVYEPRSLMRFYRDRANLEVLCSAIWQALGEVIGEREAEKLLEKREELEPKHYISYIIEYIKRCNMELIRTEEKDRRQKLRDITERILGRPESYDDLEKKLAFWAEKYGKNIHQIHAKADYPEEIDW